MTKPAPDINLTALDGRAISLSGYRGKQNVVIAFWASWCVPCRTELPILKQFYESQRKDHSDFEFLAISIDEDRAAAVSYAAKAKLPFPIMIDNHSQSTADAWHVTGIPALFVVDKDGKVAFSQLGVNPATDVALASSLGINSYSPNF